MKSLLVLIFIVTLALAKENISNPSYYKVSWRDIFCIREPCDRYTFSKLNTNISESAFDIHLPSLFNGFKKYLSKDESNSVIFYGHFENSITHPFETLDFFVSKAYKKLPLPQYSNEDENSIEKFYFFTSDGNNKISVLINDGESQLINSIIQPYPAQIGAFDDKWLNSKTFKNSIDDDSLIGQGIVNENGVVLISNSYVYLPDSSINCKQLPQIECDVGYMAIYNRNENRCHYYNQTCILKADPESCTFIPPECPSGYKIDVWKGAKGGCNLAFRCDAYFLKKTI